MVDDVPKVFFGITGAATLISNLITSTGNDQGLLSNNPSFNSTGLAHIYQTGFIDKVGVVVFGTIPI